MINSSIDLTNAVPNVPLAGCEAIHPLRAPIRPNLSMTQLLATVANPSSNVTEESWVLTPLKPGAAMVVVRSLATMIKHLSRQPDLRIGYVQWLQHQPKLSDTADRFHQRLIHHLHHAHQQP